MLQRRFQLHRKEDESGVSGPGVVAEGCQFSNNECVVVWLSKRSSLNVYGNIADVEAIHGHEGKTRIVWLDQEPQVETVEVVTKRTEPQENGDKPPAEDGR